MEGFDVTEAASPESARELLKKGPPDLIITDTYDTQWDPSLPWLETIREVAGEAKLILLTAYAEAKALQPTEHGLAAVLIKPIDMGELLQQISALLAA